MNSKTPKYDVIIVGGGLAGLCNAIHLSKFDRNVLLIEKNTYPQHKVCGEYVSNEVLPYLDFLDIDVFDFGAKKIDKFQLSTPNGNLIKAHLPLGGFGISRFCFDYELAKKAISNGVRIHHDSVEDILFKDNSFTVSCKDESTYDATFVIGAFGKRSNLDLKLNRKFMKTKSPYLAVKTHVKGEFPEDTVALHNFEGGYCGISKVENDHINICYITHFDAFQKVKNIEVFQRNVLSKNKYLKSLWHNSTQVFENPLTISQISFESKKPVENHILMCGDTATLIHPLSGNGMSMAIRSAQIASSLIIKYFNSGIAGREALEKQYLREWNATFKTRLKAGRFISILFSKSKLSEFLMRLLKWFPALLPIIIKRTHGEVMQVK